MWKLYNGVQLQSGKSMKNGFTLRSKACDRERAFTLIELLATITVLLIIFAVGFAGFRDFSRREQITSATRKVVGGLRLAQQQAFAGNKPADPACDPPEILHGYNFRTISAQEYSIEASCSGGDIEIKRDNISSNISLTLATNPILFKTLGTGTNIPSGTTVQITITQDVTNDSRVVEISHTGDIK